MKKKITNLIWVLIFLGGLLLLLYPTVSDYWNSFTQSRAIAVYDAQLSEMSTQDFDSMWEAAYAYQAKLSQAENYRSFVDENKEEYEAVLNTGTGVMGYIEIPKINVRLPIYHGTDEAVLQVAIGHLDWTSLPLGEKGTHAVFSGHRGLPSAKLFSELDKLVEGDVFVVYVLDRSFTYMVDQILIVEPEDTNALMPETGKDYVTLLTCTPYGINSHRLLVRGIRTDDLKVEELPSVYADALQIDGRMVMPIVAIIILIIYYLLKKLIKWLRKEKRNEKV